jgi:chromosome segregation ATPase
MIWKRVTELEEANARLNTSNAEIQQTNDSSSEVVTLLRRELDEEIENYELLKNGSDSLLEERNHAQYRAVELESELAEVKASAGRDIAALEARLAALEARATEDSTAAEKRLADFRTELPNDLAHLREAYQHNI